MRKPVIVKVFLASVIIFAASIVLAVLATALGVGNLVMSGPDVTGYDFTASGIVAVTIAAIAVIAALGAIVLYLVAWVGAMVNAAQLAQPLWLLIRAAHRRVRSRAGRHDRVRDRCAGLDRGTPIGVGCTADAARRRRFGGRPAPSDAFMIISPDHQF